MPELASLFELDWEQMFDEDRDRFLTRSRRTTLVRDLELPIVLLDLPGTRPLRILVVGSQPAGWPVLDFDDEVERIRATWAECDDVLIETMPRARLRDLEARLERGDAVHIMHFIGHGTVDEAEVEGMLLFERRDGSEHPVTGKELAERLEGDPNHVLDLVPFFEGRPIREPEDWEDKVLPYLHSFLRQHVRTRRSLILRLDAHLTVSFAAGRLIDTRGVDVTIRQALPSSGFIDWNVDFDRPWDGPLWKICDLDLPESAGNEVALAIGITSDATAPVERYVKRHRARRPRNPPA
ncbi:MAG: SAVED domain-containing protein [bacterium]|nr:SAVED domain-containing protein [bacterium]